jgi:hypothetical protein
VPPKRTAIFMQGGRSRFSSLAAIAENVYIPRRHVDVFYFFRAAQMTSEHTK